MRAPATVVTGLGLITPAGIGVAENWRRVLSGRPTATALPEFADLPVSIGCRVPDTDMSALLNGRRTPLWRLDRFTRFALVATAEALRHAGLTPGAWDSNRVGIVLGCGAWGTNTAEAQILRLHERGPDEVSPLALPMSLPNMAAAQLAIQFTAAGPNLTVTTACAAGANAIGIARSLLTSGAADIMIAGGTEAVLTRYFLTAFARMGALSRGHAPESASRPFDPARDGFVMGEGAGILVMETEPHAQARGATVHARLAGYATTSDAFHVTSPAPMGTGAALAIRRALTDAGLSCADIGHINAHGTSTPLNDRIESTVIDQIFAHHPPVTSTKGVTGHALGAAGAIEAVYTVLALRHGTIPPTANLSTPDPHCPVDVVHGRPRDARVEAALSNSFGFGGQNAVLAFTRN